SQTLSATGTYTRTIPNAVGCDSVITLNLFVRPAVAVTASASGFNLSATAGFVSYQWKLNGSAISGANAPTYTAVANGTYTVEVTDANGCKGTSNGVNVNGVGIEDLRNLNLSIYPNPATDIITIVTDEQITGIELFSAIGQKINVTANAKQQINISDLAAGAYSLIIHTTNGSIQKRFVKE
ncbi:MAG: T9SS type A sorting domain-containing protein, partial [Chitinophagales bacterium]|nr:T9SS type A sorting domain-containing protein [Chitinophagales bacterium]